MIHASPVLVIAGSLRPRRIAHHIAEWVADVGRAETGQAFERIEANAGEIDPAEEFGSNLADLTQAFGELAAACETVS